MDMRRYPELISGTGVTHPGKNDTKEIHTNFITKMEDLTGKQTEFREELWGGLVDHIRIAVIRFHDMLTS